MVTEPLVWTGSTAAVQVSAAAAAVDERVFGATDGVGDADGAGVADGAGRVDGVAEGRGEALGVGDAAMTAVAPNAIAAMAANPASLRMLVAPFDGCLDVAARRCPSLVRHA